MKLSICPTCGHLLQFESMSCRRCGAPLGFIPGNMELSALVTRFGGVVSPKARPDEEWHPCGNAGKADCNWLVPVETHEPYCLACRLNRDVADLSDPAHLAKWRAIECAKRRLLYSLMRLGLPIASQTDGAARGLAFDFRASTKEAQVFTGHADGLITINIAEACSAERERQRIALGEPYRTLVGHMRHEAGHFYQEVLVTDAGRIEECRAVFGDETEDYGEALKRHYANGPREGWENSYVSSYAAAHPWEDFAETWTHYLHIVDALDTAATFGLTVVPADGAERATLAIDPYDAPDIDSLLLAWLPLTSAVNALNRSMGQPDLYPFELAPLAVAKLGFIHDLVRSPRGERSPAKGPARATTT
ncbi:putative zinc-binding metallopeptidase [uncultured Amaricoccus sp.]|mgnify:CR=1 FL=1|uniref:zinc-binding metallopeptidase family protein n=1 Tax=uncultured Amaricoccus sp. TaxID=339341 RepID=UPI00260D1C1C|nr:putative zinc-binding metallopeptidase [uncultured Amaricoccus sp.]